MFLRKDKKKIEKGTQLVPFCNSCNSQDIKTIQYCKKCGSHDIKSDWTDDRSSKKVYTEVETYVYKCDCCGKEFDGFKVDNIISYNDYGEFVPYKATDDYGDCGTHYDLNKDLCIECKHKITDKLNKEIGNISKREHVLEILEEVITNEGK